MSSILPFERAFWITCINCYLAITIKRGRYYHLVEKIGPDYVEELKSAKETIEDIIGREHVKKLHSIKKCGVENPGWVHSTSINIS